MESFQTRLGKRLYKDLFGAAFVAQNVGIKGLHYPSLS